jgi:hypothetical protein
MVPKMTYYSVDTLQWNVSRDTWSSIYSTLGLLSVWIFLYLNSVYLYIREYFSNQGIIEYIYIKCNALMSIYYCTMKLKNTVNSMYDIHNRCGLKTALYIYCTVYIKHLQ